jgi:WhiB family transcriptional regulator, redox-sensing transcriptional regulator
MSVEALAEVIAEVQARRPQWMALAACRGVDPELFYTERGESTREAKAVCAGCPVREECLLYAVANVERYGVWGGRSERERRRMRSEARTAVGAHPKAHKIRETG